MAKTVEQALCTTRAVRKRLDLTRPVARTLLEDCLALALQAPTGGNRQGWGLVAVTDPANRPALADLDRRADRQWRTSPRGDVRSAPEPEQATFLRIRASSGSLAERLHDVPVHVIPVIRGRTDNQPIVVQASLAAMRGTRSPRALASRRWPRRRTTAADERTPASSTARSASVGGRTAIGALMRPRLPRRANASYS